jgi:GAF domain-containing protein
MFINSNSDISLLPEILLSMTEGETDRTANLANASALLMQFLPHINWAGFYRVAEQQLILGPFQGKPACVRIEYGKGVCGTAWKEDRIQRIENVHTFSGHIACDCDSNSEIVIPLHKNGTVWGVLDIDSPEFGRFTLEDQEILIKFSAILEKLL